MIVDGCILHSETHKSIFSRQPPSHPHSLQMKWIAVVPNARYSFSIAATAEPLGAERKASKRLSQKPPSKAVGLGVWFSPHLTPPSMPLKGTRSLNRQNFPCLRTSCWKA